MIFRIKHVTTYRYANPVELGRHRLMFRPRDSHDLRILDTSLTITPPAARIRWLHDVFGNSVTIVDFACRTDQLSFVSEIQLDQYPGELPPFAIEDYARAFPFGYSAEEVPDLGRTIERHYPDPKHRVDTWARQFAVPADSASMVETLPMLERMTLHIRDSLTYQARYAEGVQTPAETLELGRGSCRDYSLLMMEAARSLGLAARFVSGYLYDPSADGSAERTIGGGASHAWVQIYLPGAGWAEFDPTNGIIGNRNLIRVAVARDPSQAIPVSGEWTGRPADYLGMEVSVSVLR
jgi:transglutaminase-like putative cysteine protease